MGDYADGKPYGGHQAHRLIVQADEERAVCICSDPENCTEPIPGKVCRQQAGMPGKSPSQRD